MGAFIVALLTFVVAPAVAIAVLAAGTVVMWHAVDSLIERLYPAPAELPARAGRPQLVAFPMRRVESREDRMRRAA